MRGRLRSLVTLTAVVLSSGFILSSGSGPATALAVSGTVIHRGSVEPSAVIDMSADAYCAQEQESRQARTQPIRVGEEGRLADVIVYVKQGAPDQPAGADLEPTVLDQEGCVYQPPTLALRTGQQLIVRNSDATLHNVHVSAEVNRSFNIGQPFQGVESRRQFSDPEIGIQVKCDVHGWMNGSIAVFDHGYFDVTENDGQFQFDLPPGDYELEAWHPVLGTRTQTVTVSSGQAPEVTFEF